MAGEKTEATKLRQSNLGSPGFTDGGDGGELVVGNSNQAIAGYIVGKTRNQSHESQNQVEQSIRELWQREWFTFNKVGKTVCGDHVDVERACGFFVFIQKMFPSLPCSRAVCVTFRLLFFFMFFFLVKLFHVFYKRDWKCSIILVK